MSLVPFDLLLALFVLDLLHLGLVLLIELLLAFPVLHLFYHVVLARGLNRFDGQLTRSGSSLHTGETLNEIETQAGGLNLWGEVCDSPLCH